MSASVEAKAEDSSIFSGLYIFDFDRKNIYIKSVVCDGVGKYKDLRFPRICSL